MTMLKTRLDTKTLQLPKPQVATHSAEVEGLPSLRPDKRLDYPLTAFLLDAFSLLMAFFGTTLLQGAALTILQAAPLFAITAAIWLLLYTKAALYASDVQVSPQQEMRVVLNTGLLSLLVTMGILYGFNLQMGRFILLQYSLLGLTMLLGWRVLYHSIHYIQYNAKTELSRRVLLIGTAEYLSAVGNLLRQVERVELVGVVSQTSKLKHVPVLATEDEAVAALIAQHQITDVVQAFSRKDDARASQLFATLQALPVRSWVMPAAKSASLYVGSISRFEDLNLVNVTVPRLRQLDLILKRAFDVIVSATLLLLVAPALASIALLIKLESNGPVLFVQERMGRGGKSFRIFKFRSMRVGADKELDHVSEKDEEGRITNHKRPNDPRVTRIGRIIRKTSLDELPQLFNVLRGDMSLVGPRPELMRLVNEYEPWQHLRFAVPQGITGWWQVNGRSETPCHMATDLDVEYLQQHSFLLDLQILLMTVPALLKGKGAF